MIIEFSESYSNSFKTHTNIRNLAPGKLGDLFKIDMINSIADELSAIR